MKYRKKPVIIEAIQWKGHNFLEIKKFIKKDILVHSIENGKLFISTLEGGHEATSGDFIIKGVKGEFYPCKPDIFEITYEKV